jgi:hypothetical protein
VTTCLHCLGNRVARITVTPDKDIAWSIRRLPTSPKSTNSWEGLEARTWDRLRESPSTRLVHWNGRGLAGLSGEDHCGRLGTNGAA